MLGEFQVFQTLEDLKCGRDGKHEFLLISKHFKCQVFQSLEDLKTIIVHVDGSLAPNHKLIYQGHQDNYLRISAMFPNAHYNGMQHTCMRIHPFTTPLRQY